MRLTLRTMLAYMDGILEPEDAEDIRKKIEESEFATNLLHRTRDVMRRLRLAAPGLLEAGRKLDANTVAEYLDNTLDSERVTDFEKVCLDSDIHLAEVSSCHQILTLVLGEPAEIDPASRERMYRLIEQVSAEAEAEKPADADAVAAGVTSPEEAPEPRRREKPTVPDYLREPPPQRRWLPVAAAVVLALCLVVVILAGMGHFEPGTFLGNLLGFKAPPGPLVEGPEVPPVVPGPEAGGPGPGVEGPEEPPIATQPPEPGTPGGPEISPPPETPEPGPATPPAREPGTAPGVAPPSAEPAEPATPGGPAEQPGTPPAEPPAEPGTVPPGSPAGEPPSEPPAVEPVPRQSMGRFTAEDHVLLRFESDTKTWRRLLPQAEVSSGERLLALPTYRPLIALTTGVAVELVDGTEIELLPPDAAGTAGMKIAYGRAILRSVGQPNVRLRLQFGRHTGEIAFGEAESTAAVDVTRVRMPGTDPGAEPAMAVAYVYAVTGGLQWNEAGGDPASITPDSFLTVVEQTAPAAAPLEELPAWITSAALSTWDGLASPVLQKEVGWDSSAGFELIELANHRRKEVAWLAARCLGYMGQPESLVAVLNEPESRQLWPKCIEELQQAVSRGTQAAGTLREALERRYTEDGDDLYRMLWGYTQENLDAGEAARLVGHLDCDTLAVRVLSFWNLKEITGWGLFYKPEQTAAKRKTAVTKWRERLDSGEIRFKTPETPEEPPEVPAEEAAPEVEQPPL